MFIKEITLCNVFSYYGEISVRFEKNANGRNLYCIYGNNGYGKTSFLNCAKLLFLGSGLLEEENKVPPIIANMLGGDNYNIKNSPKHFVMGNNKQWLGVLNTMAQKHSAHSQFFIRFSGEIEEKDFIIQRSWSYVNMNEVQEQLKLKIGADEFYNEEAQERLNAILPPDFVELFFFDGEEIESVSDNLRTDMREKIEKILQIKPLQVIIEQIEKYKDELTKDEMKNETTKHELEQKELDLTKANKEMEFYLKRLEDIEEENKNLEDEIKNLERSSDKLIKDLGDTQQSLVSEKENYENQLRACRNENLQKSLKDVMFAGNINLLGMLLFELDKMDSNAQNNDLESFKNYSSELKEFSKEEIKDINEDIEKKKELQCIFENIIDNFVLKISEDSKDFSMIPTRRRQDLRNIIARLETSTFGADVMKIKDLKIKILRIKEELEDITVDTYTRIKREELLQKIEEKERKLKENKEERIKALEAKIECKKILEELDKEIASLRQSINTERISKQLEILKLLKEKISIFKDRLVEDLRSDLQERIIENYKKILNNDNINSIEIGEDFEIILKNHNNETIVVENQSSGQKQILAISIFWALSELSKTNLPLIIDTPLARIDSTNRINIIQNYYKQENQVIILPTDTEISNKEYEYAKPCIAQVYKIENDETRSHSKIKPCSIQEIL